MPSRRNKLSTDAVNSHNIAYRLGSILPLGLHKSKRFYKNQTLAITLQRGDVVEWFRFPIPEQCGACWIHSTEKRAFALNHRPTSVRYSECHQFTSISLYNVSRYGVEGKGPLTQQQFVFQLPVLRTLWVHATLTIVTQIIRTDYGRLKFSNSNKNNAFYNIWHSNPHDAAPEVYINYARIYPASKHSHQIKSFPFEWTKPFSCSCLIFMNRKRAEM